MGNNELMILQLPRTFYFFESAWRLPSKTRAEPDVLGDLAGRLYPDHARSSRGPTSSCAPRTPAPSGPSRPLRH